MGLIVDTNLFIRAERGGVELEALIDAFRGRIDETHFGIASITLAELAHGQERADHPSQRRQREIFLSAVSHSFTVYPLDSDTAIRAGLLDGLLERRGKKTGLADLLIAATALQLGYGVLTLNFDHFAGIPHLRVVDARA